MARTFVANFEDVAITAAQDLFEILAPTSSTVMVLEWTLFQSTDVGDSEEEILELETVRGDGAVTSGTGGTTSTAQPLDNGDGAPGSTVEVNNTTRMVAGGGTLDVLRKYGWNIRIPMEVIYIPETRPIITQGDRWTLSLNDAPTDSITVSGSITFAEIGG